MGMAEEVIIKPNYEKLCSKILNSDEHIRFTAFVNDKSKILYSEQKDNLDSLLQEHEFGMSVHYTLSYSVKVNLSFPKRNVKFCAFLHLSNV